jgi:hypothetical protein
MRRMDGGQIWGNVAMKNDAKLGLVIGLGVVLAVAVTYYPKNSANAKPPSSAVPAIPSGAVK